MPTIQRWETFVGLTILAQNQFFLMKQNGMKLENKTPREITNMDREISSKGCSEVKQVAMSTLQEKNILQKQQSFVNKIT